MWCRSSTSLLRVLCGKGERPFPSWSSDACGEKEITRTFSQSHIPGQHFDLHFETQSCFTSLAGEVHFVD
jgi:hypothetical protein